MSIRRTALGRLLQDEEAEGKLGITSASSVYTKNTIFLKNFDARYLKPST